MHYTLLKAFSALRATRDTLRNAPQVNPIGCQDKLGIVVFEQHSNVGNYTQKAKRKQIDQQNDKKTSTTSIGEKACTTNQI